VRKLMLEQRKRVEELISSIREEKNGFKLGKPWRHSDKSLTCVVPILKLTSDDERGYITITEAKKISITDTGRIDEARIKNNEDMPIFLRLGEILAGGTQERAITSSRIIFPGEEVTIPVACIHLSKGIQKGAEFHFSGYASHKDYSYLRNTHDFGEANQQESWNLDNTYVTYANTVLNKHGFETSNNPNPNTNPNTTSDETWQQYVSPQDSSSNNDPNYFWDDRTYPTGSPQDSIPPNSPHVVRTQQLGYYQVLEYKDDLTTKHNEVNELLADIIKKVPLFEDQIGLALIDPEGFKCLDCYDVKLSYKAIKEALVGKETAAIADTDEENVFEYKPEVAKKAINKVLDNSFVENVVHEHKNCKTITLDLEGYMGEAVLLDNKVVHLVVTRKD